MEKKRKKKRLDWYIWDLTNSMKLDVLDHMPEIET